MSEHVIPLAELRERKAQAVRPNPEEAPRPDLREELLNSRRVGSSLSSVCRNPTSK